MVFDSLVQEFSQAVSGGEDVRDNRTHRIAHLVDFWKSVKEWRSRIRN